MNSLQLKRSASQTQTLSPRLQRAVQLLQMSSLDFAALVRGKLDQNPFLEIEEEEQTALDHATGDAAPVETRVHSEAGDDREMWLTDRSASRHPEDSATLSAVDLSTCDTMLNTHLHGQLDVTALSERDASMARAIVESLDDDGYLRTPLGEIAPLLPLRPAPDAGELLVALRLVQSLEPAGVGARDVGECLALQCRSIENAQLRDLARLILKHHLQALAARDIPRIGQALGAPAWRIEEAVDCIRRLHPRPGWAVGSSRVDYIVPDVIVRRGEDGSWNVRLNPAVVPKVRLHKVYEQLFQRHRGSGHAELNEHLQDARWTLRNVRQRYSTILDVARAIVRRQHLFLEFGAMAMKPLILRDIAEEVGIHESTVSRVTSNKYMSTPLGVFELKHFFSRPMLSASGKPCSATAIRELVADIIASEAPESPWSDGDIARQLARQGLAVARRTVTKYRQLLKIEAADKRRRHG